MKTATITEAKNGLSALIDQVKAGDSIVILDRGVPVATLEPVTKLDDPDGRMTRLVRAGVVRPGKASMPVDWLLSMQPVKPRGGASVVEALLEERRTSR